MDLRELNSALERAGQHGALGAELLLVEDRGQQIEMHEHRPSAPIALHDARIDVRVWIRGGREGHASGAPRSIAQLLEQAVLAAGDAPENPMAGPVQRQAPVSPGLSIRDRRHEQLTAEDRADVLTTAERAAASHDARLIPAGFRYRDRLRVRRFASTRGVALEEWSTTYLVEGEVSVRHDDGTIRLMESIASRSFASIASLPFGTAVARRASALLVDDGITLPSGPVRVVLPARVVAAVVASIARHFAAASFAPGGTFFLQPGEDNALDPRLHLLDDGTIAGGLRSRSFDDRGASPVPLTLLREGRVDGRFVSVAEARAAGLPPTGHLRAQELVPSNLILKSGTRSVSATLSDIGALALRVDQLPDLSSVDPTTGDYDARVNGVVMSGNQPAGAMRNVRLRGNLRDVLRSVVEVCSDTDRVGHVDAPALIVNGFELDTAG